MREMDERLAEDRERGVVVGLHSALPGGNEDARAVQHEQPLPEAMAGEE
jgi:hypothetical protein